MLVQFSIKNYRTFLERATLSLIASNYDKDTREEENIFSDSRFRLRLLKSAVVYGANASGKSKFLEAFAFMRYMVLYSSSDSRKGEPIDVHPFRLNVESEQAPSEFEIVFLHNQVLYRYGFEVTHQAVVAEWLYQKEKVKEVELFYRDQEGILTHARAFSKGRTIAKEGLVRDNALFVSVAAQFNEDKAGQVVEWFKRLRLLSGLDESGHQGFTLSKAMHPDQKVRMLSLLKAADLGIRDIHLKRLEPDQLPHDIPSDIRDTVLRRMKEENAVYIQDVQTVHAKVDAMGQVVDAAHLSLKEDESSGTRKFFALTGPMIDVLEHGYVLIADELDAKLHPNLVASLVALFNNRHTNPHHAQLVFNTHDTNLLSSGLFRRDQIWFTEKKPDGAANLFSLADYAKARRDESFEENYLRGKYGAVPFLGYFDTLTLERETDEEE